MQPALAVDRANLTGTEEAANGDPAQIPRGHSAVVVRLTEEVLPSPQTAEHEGTLGLLNRVGTRVLNEEFLEVCP